MSRRKPKSAEAKQNIKKGLRAYWDKTGKKHAALAAGLAGTVVVGRQGIKKGTPILKKAMIDKLTKLDERMGESLKNTVYEGVTGTGSKSKNPLVEALMNSRTVKGTKEGLAQGIKDKVTMEQQKAANSVKAKVDEVVTTPQRTVDAFNTGLNVKPTNENDPNVNRGKALGRVYNRARQDTKKVKSWFGFSQQFFFEPNLLDENRHPRLIEFAKRKKKPSAKKPLSAAHKAKISAGLQEYYDSIPKKEETIVDKGEKVTKSIGRVARSAKTFAEAANLAANVYERFKKPEVRQGIGAGILGAAAVVSGVAGSFRDVGSATRSLAGAADIVHDLATGSKKKRQKYREDVLQAKREANKTNRQVHSVRAKLERRKMEQKKEDQRLKGITSEAYEKLVDTTARIKPFEIAAALQRAATGAKDKGINKGDDYWFMPEETLKVKK